MRVTQQREEVNTRIRAAAKRLFLSKALAEKYEREAVLQQAVFLMEALEQADFVSRQENLVLYGPVGTGKTHMAIATGIEACKRGWKTRFYTVADLILSLLAAKREERLDTDVHMEAMEEAEDEDNEPEETGDSQEESLPVGKHPIRILAHF